MNLYTKYRPQTLDEVKGNKELKKQLNSIFQRATTDLPHCFMLTGQSGCGKTTIARIIAKRLNCYESEFYEYDSASDRGIDAMRRIRKEMLYAPMAGNCKVYFMDEAHQITKDAQEALLKALEDTPEHVYFIMATTEPDKFKDTFLNRFVQFKVEPIDEDTMFNLIDGIAFSEGKENIPEEVIEYIISKANGSSRDAIQRLEQIIDLPFNEMLESLKADEEQNRQVKELCQALIKASTPWKTITCILKNLKEDPENIRHMVLGYCASILMKEDKPYIYLIMDAFKFSFYNTGGRAGLVMACYQVYELTRK